ncbi:MAG: hypothetical protein QOH63_820 [Acidobacteriota bacterium]|nr:hypothetical protein [Acidobacteriota bacterium]
MIRRGPAAGSTVGAGSAGVVVRLAVVPGRVRVVRGVVVRADGVRVRLVRGVRGFGGAGFVASAVAGVSAGVGVSDEGVAGVSVAGGVVAGGSGSSIRAPVAVTRLPLLLVDETVGTTGSTSGTSLLIGSNAPSKRMRKLPSLSFGVRASTRRIKASRVFK